jgi:hypothetical protein
MQPVMAITPVFMAGNLTAKPPESKGERAAGLSHYCAGRSVAMQPLKAIRATSETLT